MTQSIVESPNGGRPRAVAAGGNALEEPVALPRTGAAGRQGVRGRRARRFPASVVVASSMAIHVMAAALVYRKLARDLYALFDATPRLLVLEHGLTRLTAATVFLPPVIPVTLVLIAALWLGSRRRGPEVSRWLALALVPLAIDSVFRAIGVLLAPAPANMGELLDLPIRFSFGPRLVLDLAGVHPPPSLAYWAVVATVPAALSAWCVARALLAAEDAQREAVSRRSRRRRAAFDALEVGVAVIGTWMLLAFAGQVALPWAAQLFLRVFG